MHLVLPLITALCCNYIRYPIKTCHGKCPKLATPTMTLSFVCCLSFDRMVEPSPPALHLGDVSMACVGVKVEQEEAGAGAGVITHGEPIKRSPSCDWSAHHPLEARQLTPPLSRSPSVSSFARMGTKRRLSMGDLGKCRKCHGLRPKGALFSCPDDSLSVPPPPPTGGLSG